VKKLSAILALTFIAAVHAEEKRGTEGVGLTIYMPQKNPNAYHYYDSNRAPDGYAVVKEWRFIELKKGANDVRYTDVAKWIDAASVHFNSLTDPAGTFIVEQNYEYDLVSADKILEKYIDRPITLLRGDKDGNVTEETVELLSVKNRDFVVKRSEQANPIEIFSGMPRMKLGELPGGLITRPTLFWKLLAKTPGRHLCKVAYETKGIGWKASYTAVMKPGDAAVDLSGWVTIDNKSGATYKDAEIKLVAGDVHAAATRKSGTGGTGGGQGSMQSREGGFSMKDFFEFKLYTLARSSTVKDNSQKQLELFQPVVNVPARKLFVYFGLADVPPWFFGSPAVDKELRIQSNSKVDIYVKFRNSAANGLGIPLPGGDVRVYKEDPGDGSLEFIGEDTTDHAAVDEDVLLRLGNTFDVVGERKQKHFKCDYGARWMEEAFEITLRNHKTEPAEIIVREILYRWVNWEVIEKSADYEKIDSRTIHFPVTVPPDGESKVTYRVKYTW